MRKLTKGEEGFTVLAVVLSVVLVKPEEGNRGTRFSLIFAVYLGFEGMLFKSVITVCPCLSTELKFQLSYGICLGSRLFSAWYV